MPNGRLRNRPSRCLTLRRLRSCATGCSVSSVSLAAGMMRPSGRTAAYRRKTDWPQLMPSLWKRAFGRDLLTLRTDPKGTPQLPAKIVAATTPRATASSGLKTRPKSRTIDKSALKLPEPRRVRDRDHVRYVAQQPCLVCGRQPVDAHHLRVAQIRALGRKASDEFTVPLCRGHHREVHRHGDEATWWKRAGLDPSVTARSLWLETHPRTARPGDTLAVDSAADQ